MPALVGKTYDNAARSLPDGLVMQMEWGGDGYALGAWSLVAAQRGTELIVLVARLSRLDPPQYTIAQAFDLGTPCQGLAIETETCAVNGNRSANVFALMDDRYQCGGHGESAPVRAWRVTRRRVEEIDPRRVTCGSDSCEVDPPPQP
jgi:hypothetical protein